MNFVTRCILVCLFCFCCTGTLNAAITGRITNGSGVGLENVCVNAQSSSCDGGWVEGSQTDSSGDYTIDTPAGTYYIDTYVLCGGDEESRYIDKFYNSTGGTTDCNAAEGVPDGEANINLILEQGGNISGTLLDSGGTPLTGIDNVGVTVFQGSCNNFQWVGFGSVDPATGSYITSGIAPGDYILQTYMPGTQYIDEYWASGGSVPDCDDAETVTVVVGTTISNNDFNLEQGGSISGTLLDSGGTPLTGIDNVGVGLFQGSCNNLQGVGYGSVDPATGSYSTSGIAPGDYILKTNMWGTQYIEEYWASGGSVPNCDDAETVTVVVGQTNSGNDFNLEQGGSISGTLLDSGGTPLTGIDNVGVGVLQGSCNNFQWVGFGSVDPATGSYSTSAIAPGEYYLKTNMQGTRYVNEYWASGGSDFNCDNAETITVVAGQTNSGKDFQLGLGSIISGTVYDQMTNLPLNGQTDIFVSFYSGDPCNGPVHLGGFNIENDGTYYTKAGVPAGSRYMRVETGNSNVYVGEWRTDTSSDPSCSNAALVPTSAGVDLMNIDFHLDTGARISGHVYESDGITPISSDRRPRVQVFQGDPCGVTSWFISATNFGLDGSYQTGGLPEGTFFLRFKERGQDTSDDVHQREWWADPLSTPECSGAQAIIISGTNDIDGKDFQIDKTRKFPWAAFLPAILKGNEQ